MPTVEELLDTLWRDDVHLSARGEKLLIDGPEAVLTPAVQEQIAAHKQELLALLTTPDIPPPGALPLWLYDRVWGIHPPLPPPPGMTPEEVAAAVEEVRATLPRPAAPPPEPASPIRYTVIIRWAQKRGWLEVRDPFTGAWLGVRAKDAPSSWWEAPRQGRRSDG